ncbi:MAG: FAD-dependent oxidoreductase [Bacteroidetes bacterium]|nr:FAD-dependent oxidoreductase [Bacteroidota bacterium]
MKERLQLLTDAQLKSEISRCNYCEEKPCMDACPSQCSPADFIMAIQKGEPQDYKRAATLILSKNPLGGICGAVCPDTFCMAACTHKTFDEPLNIPAIQSTIIQKAKDYKRTPNFIKTEKTGKKVAIIGGGPAGLAAASVFIQEGVEVTIYEKGDKLGGMCNLIPDSRLDKSILASDLDYLISLGKIEVNKNTVVAKPEKLMEDFDAVFISTGLDVPYELQIAGKEKAILWEDLLKDPKKYKLVDKNVAIIGGGAVALDCAVVARAEHANEIDMICLEKPSELNLTSFERNEIVTGEFGVITRTAVTAIIEEVNRLTLHTSRMSLPAKQKFSPAAMVEIPGSDSTLVDYDVVVFAIGSGSSIKEKDSKGIFHAGDMVNGPTTVIEAVASGKNTATKVLSFLFKKEIPKYDNPRRSSVKLSGDNLVPVSLESEFFGRKIISPFLLSAAPPTDGYDQMKAAYEAGWAGGIMKTAFDNLSIHIPAEYMYVLDDKTFGNADNVSGHPLDRICEEVKKLVAEYPDRLTMASTGGPVTGDDEADKAVWQSNTKKLEAAGAMGIEYSLSCPQGGDGTKGDIVSQDPELTAKIVDWIMEVSDADVPKLFKLTGAVTAIYPIMFAIKQVLDTYSYKKAGVTLANTFPGLEFQPSKDKVWEDGVVVGMSGQGVVNISNLTLANASKLDVKVSGNGGPMDYKSAAHFLALGAETVQFCSIVMKYGYDIINELHSGISHLMEERKIASVKELIGSALPNPILGFMELSSIKKISQVTDELCVNCGNCTRCPYLAITLNENKNPRMDASKCIGCSFCVQNCFSGALHMRERTKEEALMLRE